MGSIESSEADCRLGAKKLLVFLC